MSETTGTKRLNAVVKELNVGMQTLAEFLGKQGHKVDAKPTTKITDEQYVLLTNEFQTDKKVKEQAHQIGKDKAKQKDITLDQVKPKTHTNDDDFIVEDIQIKSELTYKSPAKKVETPPTPPPAPKPEVVVETPQPKEEVPVAKAPKIEKPVVAEEKEVVVDDGKMGLTVMGKIDLDSLNTKTKPDKKKKEPKKGKAEKEAPIKENIKEKKPLKGKKGKIEDEGETLPPPPPEVIVEVAPPVEEEKQSVFIEPNYEKLKGLNVKGKIDLPVEQPKTPRPVASSSGTQGGKKKRKRTSQNYIGGSDSASDKFSSYKDPRKDQPFKPGTPPPGGSNYKGNNNRFGSKPPFSRGGKNQPATPKTEISEKEVQDKLKETLARLNPGSKTQNIGAVRSKLRKQKRDAAADKREEALIQDELSKKTLKVTEFVTANELAKMMDAQVNQIISACMSLGMMVSINQRLDAETIAIVAEEFGYEVEFVSAEVVETVEEDADLPEDLQPRAPIVTVMGHVDHGKTSLLDYIRKANVVSGEAGGITQHIGAYEVKMDNGKKVTFLDTPGHEAFTAMRARGAKITDIVIIVIATDDSVMPQTKEAISHAQAAGVPIIFALNKIDREGANPDRIREQLSAMDILVEEWGGKYQCQEISAKKGLNIDKLLEKVVLEAEMLNLKANPDKRAVGSVIEATLDKGRGIVTTVMVQAGTLKVGDPILAGTHNGKVKAMFDERGQKMAAAGPSTPVVILGFDGAPQAGDKFMVTKSEQEAKEISTKRQQLQREQGLRTHKHITLDEIGRRLAIGNFKELNVIVKGDVDGSVEALSDSLIKLANEEVQVSVIYKGVGQISESDVMLASASDAIIIGFNVRPSPQARKLAETESIDIRLYSIIYKVIEEIKAAIEGLLAPKIEEKITGNAEVREVFKVSKVGAVAGCMVTDGRIHRNAKVRLIRDGVVVYSGELSSLKRFKDDAKEVVSGYDCGITIANYNDIKVGDYIEAYEEVEVKRSL